MELLTYKHLPTGPGGFSCPCCQPFKARHAEAKILAARWVRRGNRQRIRTALACYDLGD